MSGRARPVIDIVHDNVGVTKMKQRILRLAVLGALASFSIAATAADYKASIAQMPVYAESQDKGVLVDLVKAIAAASGKSIEWQVVPFARSMSDVESGKVDFHMPLIKPIDMAKANFGLSTETIFHVNFVLYTNKAKALDVNKLAGAAVETDSAHVAYFPFDIKPSTNLESSLKKLDLGRIDGFIFADAASDPIIKANNLGNVKRQLYKRFDVKIILPKGGKSAATDKFLSEAIKKLRDSGQFSKIMDPIDKPYAD